MIKGISFVAWHAKQIPLFLHLFILDFLTQTTKGNQTDKMRPTYLRECLAKGGLILQDPPRPCELHQYEVLAIENIRKSLQKHYDYPRNLEQLLNDLKKECEDNTIFRHYVFPNVYHVEDNSFRLPLSDSIFKILLSISPLQNHVADYLFEKAVDLAVQGSCGPWIKTILQCFSTLDYLVFPDKITEKLIDLLDVTSEKLVRLEIIMAIPDIIGDKEHDNIALEMSRFLTEHEDLTPVILDCLSYLSLSECHYKDLQKKAIAIFRTSAQYHYFPNFVKFLMMPGRADETEYSYTIDELRRSFSWPVDLNEEICSSQVLTSASIRNTMTSSKLIAGAWLKSVSSCKLSSDHKPIDIVILVILYSTSNEWKRHIENVIKKQIKLNSLKDEILDEAFNNFSPIFRHHLHTTLDLVNIMLKHKSDNMVVSFASHWYITMFKVLEESRPTIAAVLLQHGLSCKQSLTGALIILKNISDINMGMLKPQAILMLSLLDKLDDISLNEVREIMNLLAGLAFSQHDSPIRDDMHMIIKKQLSSYNASIKVKGILAAVQAVKYLIRCEEMGDDNVVRSESISYSCYGHLGDGDTREAAQFIELISKSTKQFPDLIGFFYDELSDVMMSAAYINSSFLSWLTDAVTNDLQQNFMISELVVDKINDIEISMQYSLNNEDELECVIAINIAQLVMRKSIEDDVSISILPSLCRLVHILHAKKNDGDLGEIDALLGCAVVMPKVDVEACVEMMDQQQVFSILDCLLHCTNWFRELTNGFATQNDTNLKQKIMHRIRNIEDIESSINKILLNTELSYKPPYSSSTISKYLGVHKECRLQTKKSVQIKTKSNKKSKVDDTNITSSAKTQPSQSNANIRAKVGVVENLPLRQLNINVIQLLNSDLTTQNDECENSNALDLNSLTFLIKCVNRIATEVLLSSSRRITHFSKQQDVFYNKIKAEAVAEQIHNILPKFMMHLDDIIKIINGRFQAEENSHGTRTSEIVDLQVAMECILYTFSTYFNWIEFRKPNHSLLKSSLRSVCHKIIPSCKNAMPLKELLVASAKYFQNLEEYCIFAPTAFALIDVVKAISEIVEYEATCNILKIMAHKFLSKQWMSVEGINEKGLVFNQYVDIVAMYFFRKPTVVSLKELISQIKNDIGKLSGRSDHLESMKCITKANFPIAYRHLIRSLHDATKLQIEGGMTDSEHLQLWKDIAKLLKTLAEIAKTLENRNNLSAFLKKSQPLFKLFMTQGMPMMELKLKTESQVVIEIFKEFQYSTKFLQSLCCHSRLKSDSALMSKVPQVRYLLEQFIYKVKAALAANNCSDAFWMGNLKNKNLHGEVICSQPNVTEDNVEDSDGQLPEDNEDSDNNDEILNPDSKSVSDILS